MYSVRLYNNDYSDNQWYRNGGCRILNDLKRDKNKYGLKFFHGYPYTKGFEDFYKDDKYETRLLESVPWHLFSCCEQDSFFTSNFRYYTETEGLVLWGVFDSVKITTLLKDIFKIKPLNDCPFLIGKETNLEIIKQSIEHPFTDVDLRYLYDFCFDHIDDQYFLMSCFDVDERHSLYNKELSFNKPRERAFHFFDLCMEEELTWIKLKCLKEQQKVY